MVEIPKAHEIELKNHAKALGIPTGSAEIFIKKSLNAVQKSLNNHHAITDADYRRLISKELSKYHPDLAYVYRIYDKII